MSRVTKGVLLDGAQMDLTALVAGTMGFLKEKNIPAREWLTYIGKQFEDSWGGLEGEGVDQVVRHLLPIQIQPLGAEVISSQVSPERAEVVLTTLPSRELLEKFGTTPREILGAFGVTQREYAEVYAMFEAPAEAIGLRFTHRLGRGRQVLQIEKPSAPPATPRGRRTAAAG